MSRPQRRVTFWRRSLVAPPWPDKRELGRLARLAAYARAIPPKASAKGTQERKHVYRDDGLGRASPTAFADWVFWRKNPNYVPAERGHSSVRMMWSGQCGHKQIEQLRLWLCTDRRAASLVEKAGRWQPIYVDSPDGAAGSPFMASCLKVDGEPVRGRPDVVLRDEDTGGLIVLERKLLQREPKSVPKDGYANHWCQLWCYGWMDQWAGAPYVLLALQYWHRDWRRGPPAKKDDVARVRLCRSPRFHAWALGWFKRYGGVFVPGNGDPPAGR
jgi:hypothetical protein